MWVEYENKSNHIQPMHKAAQKEKYPFSITGVEYQRIFVPLHSKAIKGLYFGRGGCLLFCRDTRGSATPLLFYPLATCRGER